MQYREESDFIMSQSEIESWITFQISLTFIASHVGEQYHGQESQWIQQVIKKYHAHSLALDGQFLTLTAIYQMSKKTPTQVSCLDSCHEQIWQQSNITLTLLIASWKNKPRVNQKSNVYDYLIYPDYCDWNTCSVTMFLSLVFLPRTQCFILLPVMLPITLHIFTIGFKLTSSTDQYLCIGFICTRWLFSGLYLESCSIVKMH